MKHFRTILPVQTAPFSIDHQDNLFLMGSCFTENMGERLQAGKFNTLMNPFGIVYNPVSIAHSLERLWNAGPLFDEQDIFEHTGLWHSWEHHGRFSQPNKEKTLAGINTAFEAAARHLKTTNRLLLTLGTAHIFNLRNTGQIVANNHKMPATLFDERRLSVSEIVETLLPVLEKMKSENLDLQVILTVSPVRHIRNGLVENQRSKAALLLACEEICQSLPFAYYFPAYELLLDDLRDYRFYTSDMLHPSDVAADYIWQFFSETFFPEATRALQNRIEKIVKASRHRPFHTDTPEYRAFVEGQLEAIGRLLKEYPGLDFRGEIDRWIGRA